VFPEILDAIRKRDRNAAVSRMRRHIEEIRKGLEDYYRVTGAKNKVFRLKGDL